MFNKNKKKTVYDRLDEEETRIRGYLDIFLKFRPRIERLAKLYPDTINFTDLFISKRITLVPDLEIPEEFLCSCKLLGLKIEEVTKESSYTQKTDFYIQIKFNGIVGEECED